MKKIIVFLLIFFLITPAIASSKYATVYHPETGHRKTVLVGDKNAFKGGYVLETNLGAAIPSVVADFQTSLASKLTPTETNSMTLVSGTTDDGTTLNGTYGFTLDDGNSNKEYIVATCVDTACVSLVRGISVATGSSSVAALKKEHRRGASVKITDHPLLAILSNLLNGRDVLPAQLKYDPSLLINDSSATNTIPNIEYVNNVATSGVANASETIAGKGEIATRSEAGLGTSAGATGARLLLPASMATSTSQVSTTSIPVTNSSGKLDPSFLNGTENYTFNGNNIFGGNNTFSATSTFSGNTINGKIINSFYASTTITAGQAVYMATSSHGLLLSDANATSTFGIEFLGIALNGGSNGTQIYVQSYGVYNGLTGLTPGAEYYVSDTAGAISTTMGTYPLFIGRSLSSTELLIDRQRIMGNPILQNATSTVAWTDSYVQAFGYFTGTGGLMQCTINETQIELMGQGTYPANTYLAVNCFAKKGSTWSITSVGTVPTVFLTPIN